MGDSSMSKKVLEGLKQVTVETGEKLVKETGKIVESVIMGKELLGDINILSNNELAKKQAEEEKEKRSQISDVRSQMKEQGRDVEKEIEQIRQEKSKEEEEKEKQEKEFLENVKKQREAEEQELAMMDMESTNPAKQKKSRGSAFMPGKKKASTADMSATKEYVGKKD